SQILSGIRWTCLLLGDVFENIKDFSQALVYLKKAEQNAAQVDSRDSHLRILSSIGDVYLSLKQYDSSVVYYSKLRDKALRLQHIGYLIPAYKFLGNTYFEAGQYSNSLECYKAIDDLIAPLRNGTAKG